MSILFRESFHKRKKDRKPDNPEKTRPQNTGTVRRHLFRTEKISRFGLTNTGKWFIIFPTTKRNGFEHL